MSDYRRAYLLYSTRVAHAASVIAVVASLLGYFAPHRLVPALLFLVLLVAAHPVGRIAQIVATVYFELAPAVFSYQTSSAYYFRWPPVLAILIFAHGAYSSILLRLDLIRQLRNCRDPQEPTG